MPRGYHCQAPNGACTPMVTIGPQSLSRIRPLVWTAALVKCFLQGFTRQHVARTKWYRALCDCYHRLSAVPARRMVPYRSRSDHLFRLQVPKCLVRHTYTIDTTISSDPPEEFFYHNTFNAKALKTLFYTILNWRAKLHIALL